MTEVGEPIGVCPNCDQPGITKRHRTNGAQYRCPRCTHKFDTPRIRERKGDSSGGSGGTIPAKLAAMTPGEFDDLRTDGGEEVGQAIQQLLDDVELGDGWEVRRQEEDHLVIDYRPVPQSRLKRRGYPGIDITDVGPIWWVGSTDKIGEGFQPENEDTRLGEKSIDCADFEDAVELVEHGMERVEIAVGEELREVHKPRLLTDGGRTLEEQKEAHRLGTINRWDPPEGDWAAEYDWTRYRGPDPWPVPGGWVFKDPEGGGWWQYYGDLGVGHHTSNSILEELDADDDVENPHAVLEEYRGEYATLTVATANPDEVTLRNLADEQLEWTFEVDDTSVFRRVEPDRADMMDAVAHALDAYHTDNLANALGEIEPSSGRPPEDIHKERDMERRREKNESLEDFQTDGGHGVTQDDLTECWCCNGLHDTTGTLCPDCKQAGCNRFSDDCESEHEPVLADGGEDVGRATHHPEDERPRKDVEVAETSVKADAEAVTRPVAGKDQPQMTGEISARVRVTVECLCGDEVTAGTIQKSVVCQGCGRTWRVNR